MPLADLQLRRRERQVHGAGSQAARVRRVLRLPLRCGGQGQAKTERERERDTEREPESECRLGMALQASLFTREDWVHWETSVKLLGQCHVKGR